MDIKLFYFGIFSSPGALYLESVVGIELLSALEPGEGGLLSRRQLVLALQQREHVLRV